MILKALIILLPAIAAQVTVTITENGDPVTETVDGFLSPTGVAQSNGSLQATYPLPCQDTCWQVTAAYAECFLGVRFPVGSNGNETSPAPSTETCLQVCDDGRYNQLSQCLNCIIANGEERPFGYSTNTSLTVAPTRSAVPGAPQIPSNPLGLIDLDQANGWLRNVTDFCSENGRSVTRETTITATPTTTGPYQTSWTSGATRGIPQWTGVVTLSDFVASANAQYASDLAAGFQSNIDAASSPGASSGNQASSGAVPSPTGTNAASTLSPRSVGWLLGMVGMLAGLNAV